VLATMVKVVPYVIAPIVVEAVALWRVINLCSEMGFRRMVFKGDLLTVVNAVCKDTPCWSKYGQLLEDIRLIMSSL
jgi:hypothetical protein